MMTYTLKKFLSIGCLVILSFVFIPFLRNKKVSKKNKEIIDQKLTFPGSTEGVKICLVEDGFESLKLRVALIQNAQRQIDICYYRIKPDDPTSHVFYGGLLEAAKRGVKINIIADAKLGGLDKRYQALLCQYQNIKVYHYNPINLRNPKGIQVSMHNKFLIVDEEAILSGGRNVGTEFFDPESLGTVISHDLEIYIKDTKGKSSVLKQFLDMRDRTFNFDESQIIRRKALRSTEKLTRSVLNDYKYFIKDHHISDALLQSYDKKIYSVEGIEALFSSLEADIKEPTLGYAMLALARKTEGPLYFQTPYATADAFVLDAFREISKEREMNLLTNSLSSSPNFPAFSNYWSQRKKFLKTGISIHEFQSNGNVSLHTKASVFDAEIAAVGTLNLDGRSLYINTETMIIVKSERFAKEVKATMDHYLKSSIAVHENPDAYIKEVESQVPFAKRLLMWISGIISRIFQRFV